MDRDKIFDNTYNEQDLGDQSISFTLSPSWGDSMDPDDRIHYDSMLEKVDELIKGSKFENLSKVTEDGILKRLNKVQINQVFCFIIDNIGSEYTKIDIFGAVSDYFNVLPNKFYNSLSNKYKDELIKELDDKYNILEKKNIRKLF